MRLEIHSCQVSTPRLWLRPYTVEMAGPFWQVLHENRHRLTDDFPDRTSAVVTLKDAERRIRALQYQWNDGDLYSFGIWSKEVTHYLGDITLRRLTPGKPYGEVGYYLSAEAEGLGYASESLREVLRFAFQTLEMEWVKLRCGVDNEKSQRVAERSGFVRTPNPAVAISKNPAKKDRPLYLYRITRQEFESQF